METSLHALALHGPRSLDYGNALRRNDQTEDTAPRYHFYPQQSPVGSIPKPRLWACAYVPRAADPLSSEYQPSGSIAIVATKVMKAGARGDSLRWSGEAVCDGTASLVLARHH